MSEVAERRTTVLVSSHNLRELEDVCDHVGIMNHGKVIIERSLFDLHGNISKSRWHARPVCRNSQKNLRYCICQIPGVYIQ